MDRQRPKEFIEQSVCVPRLAKHVMGYAADATPPGWDPFNDIATYLEVRSRALRIYPTPPDWGPHTPPPLTGGSKEWSTWYASKLPATPQSPDDYSLDLYHFADALPGVDDSIG